MSYMLRIVFYVMMSFLNIVYSQTLFIPNNADSVKALHEKFPDADTLYLEFSESPQIVVSEIGLFESAKVLYCYNIISIPKEVYKLKNLEELIIQYSFIDSLPDGIGNLENLRVLNLLDTNISKLPKGFCTLLNLERLILIETCIDSLPENIWKLQQLREISYCYDLLSCPPYQLSKIKSLEIIEHHISPDNGQCPEKKGISFDIYAFREWLIERLPDTEIY